MIADRCDQSSVLMRDGLDLDHDANGLRDELGI